MTKGFQNSHRVITAREVAEFAARTRHDLWSDRRAHLNLTRVSFDEMPANLMRQEIDDMETVLTRVLDYFYG